MWGLSVKKILVLSLTLVLVNVNLALAQSSEPSLIDTAASLTEDNSTDVFTYTLTSSPELGPVLEPIPDPMFSPQPESSPENNCYTQADQNFEYCVNNVQSHSDWLDCEQQLTIYYNIECPCAVAPKSTTAYCQRSCQKTYDICIIDFSYEYQKCNYSCYDDYSGCLTSNGTPDQCLAIMNNCINRVCPGQFQNDINGCFQNMQNCLFPPPPPIPPLPPPLAWLVVTL